MKKYSFSYNGINPNFVISDFGVNNEIDKTLSGMLDILSNILMRGVPTFASKYLLDTIGEGSAYNNTIYSFSDKDLSWDTVIKGGTTNPAISFYNFLKNKCKNDYMYFLPECPMNDITFSNNEQSIKIINNSSVDFYSPFHNIVIEIDGSQHNEPGQAEIDRSRDSLLKMIGCNIIRIPTTTNKENKIQILNNLFKMIYEQSKLFKNNIISNNDISDIDIQYMLVARIQICLIELFRAGVLDKDNKKYTINIVSNYNDDNALYAAIDAYDDIKLWLQNLYTLNGESCNLPDIEFVSKDSTDKYLTIDVDCLSHYDENILNISNKYIYIRNDYFAYNRFAPSEPITFSSCKNYYHTYSNNFRFNKINITDSKKTEALKFFLKNIFGFDDFRPKQIEIIASALNYDNGTIGLLPTGSGKSICYQLAGMLTPGITMVVAPLTVLMKDQCDNLYTRNHINAYEINSDRSSFYDLIRNKKIDHEHKNNIRMIPYSKNIYIAPERFFSEQFLIVFDSIIKNVGEVVIDEVHCLSEWGHDFRTSYLMLFKFLRSVNIGARTLLIGTSATSSPRVTNDIIKEFETVKEHVDVIKGQSLTRKELTFEVLNSVPIRSNHPDKKENSVDMSFNSAIALLKNIYKKNAKLGNKMLIFSAYARKEPAAITYNLQESDVFENYQVGTYIGNDETVSSREELKAFNEKKAETYNNFKNGKIKCLVATKAFGMGVDIPDIRQTVHIDMASSVEGMYQEMGRAGRDGKPSTCTIIYCSTPEIEQGLLKLENSNNACLDNINCYAYGTIGKQLFLMRVKNYSPEKEADFIYKKLLPFLIGRNGSFSLYNIGNTIGRIEAKTQNDQDIRWDTYATTIDQSLYKLFILGIIPLWNLQYGSNVNNPVYTGISVNIDIEESIYNLEKYIRQFDFNYKFSTDPADKNIEKIIFEICKWNYDNYIMYRFKSLFTLHEMITSFTDSDSFMKRIENYFTDSNLLDKMITNPEDLQWMNSILIDPIVLHDQLQRYVADYGMNPIVQYLDGLTSLRIAKANKEKIQGRYIESIITGIKYFSSINVNIISNILKKTFYAISVESSKEIVSILFDRFNKEMINDSWQLKTELDKLNIISISEFDEVIKCYSIQDSLLKLKSALQKCSYVKG